MHISHGGRGAIEFRLLGNVEAVVDGQARVLTPLARTLLAALLLSAGAAVSVADLRQALWRDRPPREAANGIQVQVSRLRKALGLGTRPGGPRLTALGGGYGFDLGDAWLDLAAFRTLVASGRRLSAGGRLADAASEFDRALTLWRGEPLADLTSAHLVSVHRCALREMYLGAREDATDLLLRLGRHHELIADLAELVSRWPHRERSLMQLCVALHRSGRTSEALRLIRERRAHLADEYGLDPGDELCRLELDLLRGTVRVGAAPPFPPSALPRLLGRDRELARIDAALALAPSGTRPTHGCVAIWGPPGVGKTAVALAAAERYRRAYPDGVLYRSLRAGGCSQHGDDLLVDLLGAVGVPERAIPAGTHERAAMLRARVAGRRALLVLDDIDGEGQVRLALTARWGASIVVGRRPLVALDNATPCCLAPLDEQTAATLLCQAAGPDRLAPADEPHVPALVRWCGGLPLAVRAVVARLTADPGLTLARLHRLLPRPRILDGLCPDDLGLRASVAWAYSGLPEPTRRAFRRLCMSAVDGLTAESAASALDTTVRSACDVLADLVVAQLVEFAPDGHRRGGTRFRIVPVLRAYGRELGGYDDLRATPRREARPGISGRPHRRRAGRFARRVY